MGTSAERAHRVLNPNDYRFRYTPDRIDTLLPDEIFVFGSNMAGRHGAGAALLAKTRFGAKQGVGVGITGQCYALPTKGFMIETLPLPAIRVGIENMIDCSRTQMSKCFLVTKIGCGLAGYSVSQIGELFIGIDLPVNVIIPVEFDRERRRKQ